MEGENTENLPLLSRGGNESYQGSIDGSAGGQHGIDPSDSTSFYQSYGWQYERDWRFDEPVSGDTGNAQIDAMGETQIKTSDESNWRMDDIGSGRSRETSGLSVGGAQDFTQSCSQKRRKFVVSSKPEVRESILTKAGSFRHQQDLSCLPVVKEEVTICVELQAILCDLEIGNELQHYRLVSACLNSLAERLGAVVFITGGSDQGYLDPSAAERTTAFEVKDKNSILVERKEDRAVEIGTPVLKNDQWRWVIPELFRVLTSNFRLAFNGSTALYVRIGIGRDYWLRDLRRISKAIVLFEKRMNTYHPKSRNPVSPTDWPYSYSYIIPCHDSIPLRGLGEVAMMRKIDEARYIPELIRIINYDYLVYAGELHRRYRYSFRDVLRTNTVEFRQAIGTVDANKTLDWIHRIMKFVTSAVVTSDADFHSWADQGIRDFGIYHQFGVPSPPETSFRLRIRMRVPRRPVRAVGTSINRFISKMRKKTIYVFEQVRAGKIDHELSWFVYCWGKIDGRLRPSHQARVLFPTVVLVSKWPALDRKGEMWSRGCEE